MIDIFIDELVRKSWKFIFEKHHDILWDFSVIYVIHILNIDVFY